MAVPLISPYTLGKLQAEAAYDGRRLLCTLRGSGDMSTKEMLDGLLGRVHEISTSLRIREVLVSLEAVEFLNSSCMKSFVTWIERARTLPEPSQYRMRFRANPNTLWQRRSLEALRCFAIDLVSIED